MSPHRPSFAPRRPAKTPMQLRADWIAALEMARALARLAGDGDPVAWDAPADGARLAFGQTLTRLQVTLRDLGPENFPLAQSSAQTMAVAFLKLARDFCHPAWNAEARTACAGFLAAGAEALDRLITAQRTEMAGATARMLGERDE